MVNSRTRAAGADEISWRLRRDGCRMKPVVVVAKGAFGDSEKLEAHFGDQAVLRFCDISTPEAIEAATADASGIVVTLQPLRQGEIAALGKDVKVIGRAGVGLDSIDLDAAAAAGVSVINQPAYGATEVASHAIAMMLAIQRKLKLSDDYVRAGWSDRIALGAIRPVDELTVGLVGCGRIGSEMARMLQGIVGSVIAYDPLVGSLPEGVERVESLDELLARSDVVSLHAPLTDRTRGLINAERLASTKSGAILINVSRGPLVDEVALSDALLSGHIAGAGLDVFNTEPLPTDSPLLRAPNTLFSPHIASYSVRSLWRLAFWTIEDTVAWIHSNQVPNGDLVIRGTR
jgi:D-3-phosphoglycerate dehydrogenase